MHRLLANTISMALAGITASAFAVELDEFSLSTNLSYGYGIETNESMQGQLELSPSFDFSLSDSASLLVSGRARVDYEDQLEPGRSQLDYYSPLTEPLNIGPTGTAEIRDFYLELRGDNGLSRIGKQQIVWGRLDGIKVLDVLNPQDFREFIIDDFEDSRISLWSAYFDYTLGDWRAELAIIPDSTRHIIPQNEAWFELTAPRFRFGSTAGQIPLPQSIEQPGFSLDETGLGVRLTRAIDLIELSIVAFSGFDPEPLGRIVLRDNRSLLEQYYERRDTLGFSLDFGIGPAVVRAEYSYQPDRLFNIRQPGGLDALELDQHRGAVGFDIQGPLEIFVNVQYLVDHVRAAPSTLIRPSQDRLATVFLRKNFLYDTLSLEARWYGSFTDDDQLSSLSASYAVSESISLEFSVQSFSGTEVGLFGQFSERDRITFNLEHTF